MPIAAIFAVIGIGLVAYALANSSANPPCPGASANPCCPCAGQCPVSVSGKIQTFAGAIAFAEGYWNQAQTVNVNSRPARNNNPGDLEISGDVGMDGPYAIFSSIEVGWNALYHQIGLYVAGTSRSGINLNSTILQLAGSYTSTQQAAWATNCAAYLGGSPNDTLRQWLV